MHPHQQRDRSYPVSLRRRTPCYRRTRKRPPHQAIQVSSKQQVRDQGFERSNLLPQHQDSARIYRQEALDLSRWIHRQNLYQIRDREVTENGSYTSRFVISSPTFRRTGYYAADHGDAGKGRLDIVRSSSIKTRYLFCSQPVESVRNEPFTRGFAMRKSSSLISPDHKVLCHRVLGLCEFHRSRDRR